MNISEGTRISNTVQAKLALVIELRQQLAEAEESLIRSEGELAAWCEEALEAVERQGE